MKKTKLIGGLFSALLLASPLVSADSDYPAYDFQPTIVYQDESVVAQAEAAKSAPPSSTTTDASSAAAEASGDDSALLIGILLLAGILFAAYKKSTAAPAKAASGPTGVSRYIEQNDQASSAPAVSGVEKYLQDRV